MARKMIDCRKVPNDIGCTLTIAGTEDETFDAGGGACRCQAWARGHPGAPGDDSLWSGGRLAGHGVTP